MTQMQRTLAVIAVFVALIVGSFIWFIATWDPAQEQPVSWTVQPLEVRQA